MRYFKLLFLLLLFPLSVQAIGISVSPAKLEMKALSGEENTTDLNIKNASSDVALFEVYLDDFESFIKAEPSSFILESLKEKKIKIKVSPSEAGKYVTKVSIISRPLNKKELQIGSGVKIPFEVEVGGEKSKLISEFILGKIGIIKIPLYFMVIFLFLVLIGYIYFLKRKIKKMNRKESDDDFKFY